MNSETWYSIAVPILQEIARREADPNVDLPCSILAKAIERPLPKVGRELERLLDGGYIHSLGTGGYGSRWPRLFEPHLTERGARAIGIWPSEEPYQALLTLIDQRIASPETEDGDRPKLRAFREALVGIGVNAGGGLLAGFIQGLPH